MFNLSDPSFSVLYIHYCSLIDQKYFLFDYFIKSVDKSLEYHYTENETDGMRILILLLLRQSIAAILQSIRVYIWLKLDCDLAAAARGTACPFKRSSVSKEIQTVFRILSVPH